MKKIIYSLLALFLVFTTSCEPLEDVYEELDAQEDTGRIIGEVEFKMTADDYALTEDKNVTNSEAFSDFDQAIELIPVMLSNKYPMWDNQSIALVSFEYDLLNSVKTEESYEMVDTDYTDVLGLRFPNFGRSYVEEAKSFLRIKYPEPKRGDLVELTYKFFDGSVNNEVSKFIYTDEWVLPLELQSSDYDAIGNRFSNFDDFDDAYFKIGRYLGTLSSLTYAIEGELINILYNYTYVDVDGNRQFEDVLISYTFDGLSWKSSPKSVQFGLEKDKWVKDNTVKYTFSSSDYTTVYDALKDEAGYESAASNLDNFGNFNRLGDLDGDEPTGASGWNDVMIYRAIGVVLNDIDSDAVEGQKYVITVSVYNGSPGSESFNVIKKDNEWVKNN